MFYWYHANGDGTADRFDDSPDICKRVDSESGWFGSTEGAIIHGGVKATAFESKTEMTYDAERYLQTGEMVAVGEVTVIEITGN